MQFKIFKNISRISSLIMYYLELYYLTSNYFGLSRNFSVDPIVVSHLVCMYIYIVCVCV